MGTVRASAVGGTNSANTISTATLTPALGDLWVVIACQTGGTTSGANVTDTNADPGGSPYIKIDEQAFTGGVISIWVRQGFITGNTTSTDAIYSPGSGSTANELVVVAVQGLRATGAGVVRQHGHNSGVAAVTPSGVLGVAAVTTSVMVLGLGNTTNPPGLTLGWSLIANTGQAKPLGIEVHTLNSTFTSSSITYGSNSATDWGTVLIELSATAVDAVDMGSPAGPYLYPRRKESALGAIQTTGYTPPRVNPMMSYPAKQNTAITIPVFMRSTTDGSGVAGCTLGVQSKKYGAAFASISPTVTDRGGGWYDVALTAGMVDTLGPMPLHVTATAGPAALNNDENIIDVVAIDKQDAVRFGMSSLPNAAAGANTGLPVQGGAIPNANANAVGGLAIVTAIGQGPGGTLKPNSVIDNYTYNAAGMPTAWRVRAFATAAAADTAYTGINTTTGQGHTDNTDGEIEREKYTAEYDVATGKTLLGLKRHKDL
jgi:hypothetical protein